MTVPSPVHDLGTNGPSLGSPLWATAAEVWTTHVPSRTIHRHVDLSTDTPEELTRGVRDLADAAQALAG